MRFVHTVNNVPVWGSGLTITVKHAPFRVVSATFTGGDTPKIKKLPAGEKVSEMLDLFATAENERAMLRSAKTFRGASGTVREAALVAQGESKTAGFVRRILGREKANTRGFSEADRARMIRCRFFAYQLRCPRRL